MESVQELIRQLQDFHEFSVDRFIGEIQKEGVFGKGYEAGYRNAMDLAITLVKRYAKSLDRIAEID
jgi:hypothetical protein